jgi:hypothetical protein
MSFCPNCGNEVSSGIKCSNCGIIDEHCLSCDTKFNEGDWLCPSCSNIREHCPECGTKVDRNSCPDCGETKPAEVLSEDMGLTDKYSVIQWLAAVIIGVLTIPIGLVIPGYMFYKCKSGGAIEQTGFETWTVILMGIFGIAAVEVGGKKGAKVLWGIIIALILLIFIVIVL